MIKTNHSFIYFRIMARQLNASYNFNTGYFIWDIPDKMMEVVVKIKTMFWKHILVEDRERRTVNYRPWEKCNQPNIRMETAQKRVAPLRFRKVKEATDSGSSIDSGTWINMGEGFGYSPTILANPNHLQTSEEGEEGEQPEIPFETHPKNNVHEKFLPNDSDRTYKSMPEEEAPTPNKIKIDLGPYCPVCTPLGYRCICHDQELDQDDNHKLSHQQIHKPE